MRWAVVLLVATGCQQLLGLDRPRMSDGGDDADPIADGPPADILPGACLDDWRAGTVQFGPVQPVAGVNTVGEEKFPFVVETTSAAQHIMYFTRDADYFTATGMGASFGGVMPEASLSSASADTKISVNADQTRAFFASNRAGSEGGFDLWRAARPSVMDNWSVDQMYLGAINDMNGQSDPHASSDLLRIYITTGSPTTDQKLGVAARSNTNQAFSAPLISPTLDSSSDESDPTLTEDELLVVFTSDRTGNRDLYYAVRSGLLQDFMSPIVVPAINETTSIEEQAYITRDGCRLYFTSNRTGNSDIYTAHLVTD